MKVKFLKATFASLIILLTSTLSGVANAGVILSIDSVIENSMGENNCCNDFLVDMLNQQGLSSNYVSGVTDFATFTSSGVTHSASDATSWLSAQSVLSGYLIFDLGAEYSINNFVMWNGAGGINASVNGFSLTTSLVSDFSVSTAVGSFNGQQDNYDATVYGMTNSFARYVRLDIESTFGNSCCTAIGEIAFDVGARVNSVPEPSTLAIFALSILGLASRRFKKQS